MVGRRQKHKAPVTCGISYSLTVKVGSGDEGFFTIELTGLRGCLVPRADLVLKLIVELDAARA
jgi:hypothetical protein